MTPRMQKILDDAIAKNDVELSEAVLTLNMLYDQIDKALKIALIFSGKIEKRFQKAFVEDAEEIENKVDEMFEVLAGYYELRKQKD